MTDKEAIEELKGSIISEEHNKDGKPNGNITCDLTREALYKAIEALNICDLMSRGIPCVAVEGKLYERFNEDKFENVQEHIKLLANDYKCWDNRLTHEEAIELDRLINRKSCYKFCHYILENIKTKIEAEKNKLNVEGELFYSKSEIAIFDKCLEFLKGEE